MLRLLRWLFTGDAHIHKWNIIDTLKTYGDTDSKIPCKLEKLLQCEVCGNIKTVKV